MSGNKDRSIDNDREGGMWKCHLSEETGEPTFSASEMFDLFFTA